MHESVLSELRKEIRSAQGTSGRRLRYPKALKRRVVKAGIEWSKRGWSAGALSRTLGLPEETMKSWELQMSGGKLVRVNPPGEGAGKEGSSRQPPRLVSLRVREAEPRKSTTRLELVLRTGRRIVVDGTVDAVALRGLVELLEEIPC